MSIAILVLKNIGGKVGKHLKHPLTSSTGSLAALDKFFKANGSTLKPLAIDALKSNTGLTNFINTLNKLIKKYNDGPEGEQMIGFIAFCKGEDNGRTAELFIAESMINTVFRNEQKEKNKGSDKKDEKTTDKGADSSSADSSDKENEKTTDKDTDSSDKELGKEEIDASAETPDDENPSDTSADTSSDTPTDKSETTKDTDKTPETTETPQHKKQSNKNIKKKKGKKKGKKKKRYSNEGEEDPWFKERLKQLRHWI